MYGPDLDQKIRNWISDLRSGGFRQGKNMLVRSFRTNGGETQYEFCCLGLYCYRQMDYRVTLDSVDGTSTYFTAPDGRHAITYLPAGSHPWFDQDARAHLDMQDLFARIRSKPTKTRIGRLRDFLQVQDGFYMIQSVLAELNDTFDFTFSQIADVVEHNYPFEAMT